ncbi:HTH domain-containing protein [Candidatus Soleaferrea massiliensis]|uniref:HTH domain-containing protein n=1 Tax=Candidatus Soleaferrea massiliensis TaxID=1470354 RepID=UPI00058DE8AA|nr:HTH domain-containing protein [Candidatus Soleaferrea massiliensis]
MDECTNVAGQLKELLTAYQFNLDTLSRYLLLPAQQILELSEGHLDFLPEEPAYRFALFNKIRFLCLSAAEDKDLKLSVFLKVLISYHGLSKDTVARMAGVSKQDIEAVLAAPPRRVSDEAKFNIAVTVMSLRFFLKECEPEQ